MFNHIWIGEGNGLYCAPEYELPVLVQAPSQFPLRLGPGTRLVTANVMH